MEGMMTPEQARAWHAAIDAAAKKYPQGVDAIRALRKNFAVTVEHVGHST